MFFAEYHRLFWLVLWNIWIIFPYLGNNNPNWRTHMFQRGRYTTNQLLDRHIWRTILLVVKSLSFCLNCWSNQWCFRWLLRFPHRHWNRIPQIFARQNYFWMFWFDLPTCLLPLSPFGWWFGTFFIFYNIWDVILPIDDLHHFSRWLLHHQPDCHFKLT